MTYDLAGRKTSMHDPDMGDWLYEYDVVGNLTEQTDPRGVVTTLDYDDLQRLTDKVYDAPSVGGESDLDFEYDVYPEESPCSVPATAAGRLTSTDVDEGDGELHCYDLRGRSVKTRYVVSAGVENEYDIDTAYDALDQPRTVTYPEDEPGGDPGDREVLEYLADAYGTITGVQTTPPGEPTEILASGLTLTPWGATASVDLLGGQLPMTYDYDYRLRLKRITTGSQPLPVQDFELSFDEASNVMTTIDHVTGETVTYDYDERNRLIGATGFAGGTSAEYEYNAIGNLTRKREGQLDLTLTYPPSGAGSVRPHAVSQLFFTGTSTVYKEFGYDENGNLCSFESSLPCDEAETDLYRYDVENRLSDREYGEASVDYEYSAEGSLIRRDTDGESGHETTVYVGGIYERTVYEDANDVETIEITKYYDALGATAVRRVKPGESPAGTLHYLLADHLGGTTTVLDASGGVVASRRYWPFGMERELSGDQRITDKWFTGQRDEDFDGLGLYNYNARMYSTLTGRFLSADPLTADGLNRYSYVGNNPMGYTDPSGYFGVPDFIEGPAKAAAGKVRDVVGGAAVGAYEAVASTPGAVWDPVTGALDLGMEAAIATGKGAKDAAVACWGNELCQSVAISAGVIGCTAATGGGGAVGCAAAGAVVGSLDNVVPCAKGSAGDCGAIGFEAMTAYLSAGGGKAAVGLLSRSSEKIVARTAAKQSALGVRGLRGFLSVPERRAFDADPARGSRFLGQAVHRATAEALKVRYPGRFRYSRRGPDFLDTLTGDLVELTTPGQVAGHMRRPGFEGVNYATYVLPSH
ncbi:MAG: RHS repeat-associated core domain-containing protein [Dehalococcoidia bacterium]